jgi:hypothetical protein
MEYSVWTPAARPEREQGTDSGQKGDHADDGSGSAQETLHLVGGFDFLRRHRVRMKAAHVVVRLRSGAGGKPCRRRTLLTV